jgi:Probable zinc-ribbon domain
MKKRRRFGRRFDSCRYHPTVSSTVHVTHYYDFKRVCQDCQGSFIFFAAEQKYWFETLGFHADARAVRCAECRKIAKVSQEVQRRYVELCHLESRRPEQDLEWLGLYCALPGIKSSELPQQVLNRLAKLPEINRARLEKCRCILKP